MSEIIDIKQRLKKVKKPVERVYIRTPEWVKPAAAARANSQDLNLNDYITGLIIEDLRKCGITKNQVSA
jgi:predicted HicB family RNase H-like nuclease